MLRFFRLPTSAASKDEAALKKTLKSFFSHIAVKEGAKSSSGSTAKIVSGVLAQVAKKGDAALLAFSKKFDGVALRAGDLRVNRKELEGAETRVDAAFKAALRQSIKNIRAFHDLQKPKLIEYRGEFGETLSFKPAAIEKAGLYVPGGVSGRTPLVSSALMNVIPAQIAGVKRIVVVSPPDREKSLSPFLLFALAELGVGEIYKCGGAQAIGALAFGTKTIPAVDIITGPGNAFVTEAKRQVFGRVKIDGIFGHSEIAVISDGSGDPAFIAADLLSQAEHAGNELVLLITTSEVQAKKVDTEIQKQLKTLKRSPQILSSLKNRGAVLCVPNLESAFRVSNLVSPEHLELHIENAESYAGLVKNAGAVFLGEWASEPIGDYIAGTNHTLPTGGSARFASPLGVETFLKRMNFIRTTKSAFDAQAYPAMRLAEVEGLDAHRNALAVRLAKK
ncbi:MAG: histidinol dehydrogenase [Spirochaetia bacterium]|nr:histidinol dehydrogenase [Spirochaetia bacterium]